MGGKPVLEAVKVIYQKSLEGDSAVLPDSCNGKVTEFH